MGIYRERILPRIVDLSCGGADTEQIRRRVCAGLAGDVIEIGFGSGHNVPFYPPPVSRVTAIEPADLGWRLAQRRLSAATVPVHRSGIDGQRIPLRDDSFDAALSTWTLCTIPDAPAALREVRRVLKPGGNLHFAEHGLAPDEAVRRWQRRVEPLQKVVFGGCHLTRGIAALLTDAGFVITELDVFYQPGVPKSGGALSVGVARSPLATESA